MGFAAVVSKAQMLQYECLELRHPKIWKQAGGEERRAVGGYGGRAPHGTRYDSASCRTGTSSRAVDTQSDTTLIMQVCPKSRRKQLGATWSLHRAFLKLHISIADETDGMLLSLNLGTPNAK
jgi:hypothetical protein